ncbi:glutathione S-transferase family protein [Pseudomonas abieticivorans]|uniref:glutathione S-transferase family protein n=1 Tax=Pseudomonas abieticivorans TaxID=2931382 RepID=UPI0020BF2722|nr:glutathione S-transferase [Pseudomonas sp. PIA16]
MLKLYGFASSNYFNMVKLVLLEKGLAFEEVLLHGCQNPEILAKSPRGKIPILETPEGFVSETDVIIGYLEEAAGGLPLMPASPFERAQVKALAKEIELYIELPARVCYVEAFFGGRETPAVLKAKARRDLIKGFAALAARGRFCPYVAGAQFTIADVYFLYSVDLAQQVGQKLFGIDLMEAMPKAQALLELLSTRPCVEQVAAGRALDAPLFLARLQAAG